MASIQAVVVGSAHYWDSSSTEPNQDNVPAQQANSLSSPKTPPIASLASHAPQHPDQYR